MAVFSLGQGWWLDLYVMISRATRLEDLLLIRAPPVDFLLRGPPKFLRRQVEAFSAGTELGRARAAALAAELNTTPLTVPLSKIHGLLQDHQAIIPTKG